MDERVDLIDQAVCVGREAEQLRQLADQDRERETVHVADLRGLGEQIRNEPELRHPRRDHEHAHQQRQHRGQLHGAFGAPA